MKRNTLFLGLLVLTLLLPGCGPSGLPVIRVTGKVTFEGDSVEGANILFVPVESDGRSASGLTDANGEFLLMTQGATQNGVLPGSYRVVVSKYMDVDEQGNPVVFGSASSDPSAPSEPQKQPISKPLLPLKYERAETSGLNAEVTKGGANVFTFELTK